MAPDSWKQLYANTLAQVRSGEIPLTRLEDAHRRILRVKLRAHLFDQGRPSSRNLSGHFDELGSPAHRAVARRAARESLVLIKNQKHVLPLSPKQRALGVNPYINAADAFIAVWPPGTEGGGIADVIFKTSGGAVAHDLQGKLSFSWPPTPQQWAVNRGDGSQPLFPFGYGLRYADNGDLPRLGERGAATGAGGTDTQVFFTAGKPRAGWHWVVHGAAVQMSPPDRAVQEDAQKITWTEAGAHMDAITQPFEISSTGPFELSVANVQLETATDALVSCPGGAT